METKYDGHDDANLRGETQRVAIVDGDRADLYSQGGDVGPERMRDNDGRTENREVTGDFENVVRLGPRTTVQQAIDRAGEIQRREDQRYMFEIFDMWEALIDVTDKFVFLESLPLEDQMIIARCTEDEALAIEIWGSLEKCYQWAEKTEARLRLDDMRGETLADKLKNELYDLNLEDVPYKQYYLLFQDKRNMYSLGNMLGQLVYWSTRGARYKRDGLFWKLDDELSNETLMQTRTIERNREVLEDEYGYIETERHFVGGVLTMHYKLDEGKIALDFQVALRRYMHKN